MELTIKKAALRLAKEGYVLDGEKRNLFGYPVITFEVWLETEINEHRHTLATEKDKRGRAYLHIARNYWRELVTELNQAIADIYAEA